MFLKRSRSAIISLCCVSAILRPSQILTAALTGDSTSAEALEEHMAATLDMKAFDMSCKWSISVADDLLTSQLQVLHNTFSLLQALCKAEVMVRKINASREIAARKPTKDHIDCFQGLQACVAASYRPHW